MSRPLALSNGELHVGINAHGLVHDFYYPYVGLENHSSGPQTRHKVGVWVDGDIYWLNRTDWTLSFEYMPETLIGVTRAAHGSLGITLEFTDAVDASANVFMRRVRVCNMRDEKRVVRLFMHQAFVIGDGRSNTDTAQYLPDSDAIVHYRGQRAFVVSGLYDGRPFDQHAVGIFGIEGYEGTFRDAEDGELSGSNVEHGRVDSIVRFVMEIEPSGHADAEYWIAAGTSLREALQAHRHVAEKKLQGCLDETAAHWRQWLEPARQAARRINPEFRDSFLKSVLLIKSQIDKRGAIMASTDTTMLNYSRDAYAYCWPRDGAYIVWPLIRMGYKDEAQRFFEFMKEGLHPGGYLMHKYRADGAIGSSWHPYIHGETVGPPIQEDETAGVLFVFAQFYLQYKDKALLDEYYDSMVRPMADFLSEYIDSTTGLPKPSYDLWEEVYAVTTYTTAITYGALLAAADLAEVASDENNAVKWRTAADDIQIAARKHLFSKERRAFRKGLAVVDGAVQYDDTIDSSSLYGVVMYELFALESDEVNAAVATLEMTFGVSKEAPGLPRYERDTYHRKSDTAPSNWWIISSLWLGQYYGLIGQSDRLESVARWVKNHALESGVLPEQIDPVDGSFVSVAPLTWSHAEYVSSLLDTIE